MGGTLVNPINMKKVVHGLQLEHCWDSEPFHTLRDPETVRGELMHFESPTMVRQRRERGSIVPLLPIREDEGLTDPGDTLFKELESEFRPIGDDDIELDQTNNFDDI